MKLVGVIFLATCLGLGMGGCSRAPEAQPDTRPRSADTSEVVARVEGQPITQAALERELNRRYPGFPDAPVSEDNRRAVLEEMIRFEVLLARARAAGFDRNPAMERRINELIVTQFREEELARRAIATHEVRATDVAGYYDNHPGQFARAESVRAAVIHFKISAKATAEKRGELRQRAEAVLAAAEAGGGAAFAELVRQHSEDQATRYAGGDTGWLQRGDSNSRWEPAVVEAAFALKRPGQTSPLIATGNGFYIVRLTDRREAGVQPLEQVQEAIAYQLAQERHFLEQADFFEEMKRGLRIEVYPAALKSMTAPSTASNPAPPKLPGS